MGGSWKLFSTGHIVLFSMRPEAALLFGLGLLVCIGLTWAEDDDDIEFDLDLEDLEEVELDLEEDPDLMLDLRGAIKKGKCKNTGAKPKDKIFAPYTKPFPANKCPCWYDLSKNNCACCKGSNSMQCGWPMQQKCYKKSSIGCPGVCNNKYTLSQKGFPCHANPNDKRCAWCTKTGFQCAADKWNGPDSKLGSRCQVQNNQKYCKSVQGDCRHISGACPADRCIKTEQVNKYLSYYECQCPAGYTGNGIQCMDADGNFLPAPDTVVDVTMKLTQEVETFPFTGSEIETGAELQHLIEEMEDVDCSTGTCSSSFTLTETET